MMFVETSEAEAGEVDVPEAVGRGGLEADGLAAEGPAETVGATVEPEIAVIVRATKERAGRVFDRREDGGIRAGAGAKA